MNSYLGVRTVWTDRWVDGDYYWTGSAPTGGGPDSYPPLLWRLQNSPAGAGESSRLSEHAWCTTYHFFCGGAEKRLEEGLSLALSGLGSADRDVTGHQLLSLVEKLPMNWN